MNEMPLADGKDVVAPFERVPFVVRLAVFELAGFDDREERISAGDDGSVSRRGRGRGCCCWEGVDAEEDEGLE